MCNDAKIKLTAVHFIRQVQAICVPVTYQLRKFTLKTCNQVIRTENNTDLWNFA